MPLGFERLNERQQRPNALINFIKPLETADKAIAEDFLQRIAAQCYPVMKKNHISVMSLEEYAPNPEFLGRNFNAGEVIQLVLKDRRGQWLSLKFVQMVMMHELAHCKQMNHSRYFWGVRNEYAKQMEGLWQKKYLGEGMWGRGRGLENGAYVHDHAPDASQIPEHLCGGSYRRRGRKRKRGQQTDDKEKLTYAERQQRRIARKFGAHGEGAALGEDELLRGALETSNGGKRRQGKPKVANSKRGRELRANAALARFEVAKIEPADVKIKVEEDDSETESEWEESDRGNEVVIKDEQGHDLVKVCGDEGEDDEEGGGQEMNELRRLGKQDTRVSSMPYLKEAVGQPKREQDSATESEDETSSKSGKGNGMKDDISGGRGAKSTSTTSADIPNAPTNTQSGEGSSLPFLPDTIKTEENPAAQCSSITCPICSLENERESPICIACSHVIRPSLIPNRWRCLNDACKATKYVNAGDAGRCGLCGTAKPKASTTQDRSIGKPFGITSSDVLRWD